MSDIKIRRTTKYSVKVISSDNSSNEVSPVDAEMDARAKQAVKSAIEKAKFCKKPVTHYDAVTKRTYLEYPNGEKRYVD